MRKFVPAVLVVFTACLLAWQAPAGADPGLRLPGGERRHFWAAAAADPHHPPATRALSDLRALYRLEAEALSEYTEIQGAKVYSPETTGKLWAIHRALAKREHMLDLETAGWGLPETTYAINPTDYPRLETVQQALSKAPALDGSLIGLSLFLAPMSAPRSHSMATTYQYPWMDEAIILLGEAGEGALLHELGHVMHRQVLGGNPGLDRYLTARQEGKQPSSDAWEDRIGENFAEDYRTLAMGGADHHGHWGPLSDADRAALRALLAESRPVATRPAFALADTKAERRWQPLTGLHFVTDEERVMLNGPAERVALCQGDQCTNIEARGPLPLDLPEPGVYEITVWVGSELWLAARISRVPPARDHWLPPAPEQPPTPTGALSASELLGLMARREGWTEFPLPPAPGLLGNGWDRDPTARALAWARLTGTVSPLFAWQFRPNDRIPREEARRLLGLTTAR